MWGTARVNLRLLEPVAYQGGTWRRSTGSILTTPTSVIAGIYFYTDTTSSSCIASGSVIIARDAPDFTPVISISPMSINGISVVDVKIEIFEILNKPTCGIVLVNIPTFDGDRYNFIYNQNLTNVGPFTLTNAHWQYLGDNGLFHQWQYIGNGGTFPAGGSSTFGFSGLYDNQGTSGETRFTV